MSNKHYCFFSAHFFPNMGGVEQYTLNLAREMIRRGDRVTVVTTNVFGLPDFENKEGISIIRMPCWNVLGGRFPVNKPGNGIKALKKRLDAMEIDFVIVQMRFYVNSLIGVQYAEARKKPCILIEHCTGHFTVNSLIWDQLGRMYEHSLTWLVKRKCSHFYGVSKACCKWLTHFHIKPEGVLYNAVDYENMREHFKHVTAEFRKDKLTITYAGRLVREKGILKLIAAVQKLTEEGHDLSLLVAGEGELWQYLLDHPEKNVHLIGKLGFEDMVKLYKSTDIFCLPTDYPEGLPTTLLEAAACKCFIITTDHGGIKEFIPNDEYGIVLTDNTVVNLVDAVRNALCNDGYRKQTAERLCQRLRAGFTWEKVCDEVDRIFVEMADR